MFLYEKGWKLVSTNGLMIPEKAASIQQKNLISGNFSLSLVIVSSISLIGSSDPVIV